MIVSVIIVGSVIYMHEGGNIVRVRGDDCVGIVHVCSTDEIYRCFRHTLKNNDRSIHVFVVFYCISVSHSLIQNFSLFMLDSINMT